jgi:hypothetical protein
MIGPYLEYYEYKNWIDLTGPYQDLPVGTFQNVVPALTRMCQGFLSMFLHLFLTVYLGYSVYFCGTKEYQSVSMLNKFLYFYVGMTS